MAHDILLAAAGVLLVWAGANWLVGSASRVALWLGIRPLIVGLTVVALGTTAPEIAVGVQAAIRGNGAICLGNILGSNICNIGLILGLAAMIRPLDVTRPSIDRDWPLMMLALLALLALGADGHLSRTDGLILTLGLLAFIGGCITLAGRQRASMSVPHVPTDGTPTPRRIVLITGALVGGCAALVAGGGLLVSSGVRLAEHLGVPALYIGLLVAVGTSVPELAASLVAAWRGECDISIGNVLGSNIFNVFAAIGIPALIAPIEVDARALRVEFPAAIIFTLGLAYLMRTGLRISRREGIVLTVAYLGFMILAAILP